MLLQVTLLVNATTLVDSSGNPTGAICIGQEPQYAQGGSEAASCGSKPHNFYQACR